jgi:bifunctional non-homologous end joining protein LigD
MPVKLDEYSRKRNFEKTPEPEGQGAFTRAAQPEEGLRFVVQHHMARRDHYDLRLEWDGALLSWAVPKGPSYDPRDKRLAVQVEDHPLEYRHFEGTIPKGEYGGGSVMLWDEGTWEPYGDVDKGLREGALKFVLNGRRLQGKWALVRPKEKAGETKDNWLFLKEKDDYASTADGISGFITSVRTGRTMAQIEEGEDEKFIKNPFDKAEVQLARLVSAIPQGDDWLYEVKYDGYRIMAYVEGNGTRLITRNGHDYTQRFHEIANALIGWAEGRAMILDGEMAVTDEKGRTDFQTLQSYMRNPKGQKLTYIVFDLLALDGVDLRGRALYERKENLSLLMKDAPKSLYYSQHVRGNGKESFLAACRANLEGIVGKKADSVYSGTRNGDWIKLKCDTRQEFVIGGYTLTGKKTSGISALLLGAFNGNDLIYVGRAGTGFSQRGMTELEEKFKGVKQNETPFKQSPKPKPGEKFTWLEPVFAAEIKFAEWTEDHLLRQASFKGLRADKDPQNISIEQTDEEPPAAEQQDTTEERPMNKTDAVIIDGIRITSPDKLIFEDPDITKLDIVRYYEQIAGRMLPYISHRILSIVRCPKGISQACFYKKHPDPDSKGIVTIMVPNGEGQTEEYFYIKNASGLIYEAQMGTLEFHTWGSRSDNLEKPDMMVFDLDPDEGMDLSRIRQGVRDTKIILEELSLQSFLKTSGGKGYHVVVPFEPSVEWDAFHKFARRIAEVMEQRWPDRYTSNVRKNKRGSKIFIDWIRNGRGATSIAPYSIRARKGARVSMPITWDTLDAVAPDGVTMGDALTRIGRDPWNGYFQTGQRLK